jgi:hypothetical protein
MKSRYGILFAIIGLGAWLLIFWYSRGVEWDNPTHIESFAVVSICVLLSLAYLKFGDKKIKCLKCSNLMWKTATRCASCQFEYKKSYNECYESWDSYYERNCRNGLSPNKIKTYWVCLLVPPIVFFIFFLVGNFFTIHSLRWNFIASMIEAWEMILRMNYYLLFFSFLTFYYVTGVFEGDRENDWVKINGVKADN